MKLSEAITSYYLTHNERSEGGLGGARMIYDIRQTTTCTLRFAGRATRAMCCG